MHATILLYSTHNINYSKIYLHFLYYSSSACIKSSFLFFVLEEEDNCFIYRKHENNFILIWLIWFFFDKEKKFTKEKSVRQNVGKIIIKNKKWHRTGWIKPAQYSPGTFVDVALVLG